MYVYVCMKHVIYVYVFMDVCKYVWNMLYIYMYVCMYVCMYIEHRRQQLCHQYLKFMHVCMMNLYELYLR